MNAIAKIQSQSMNHIEISDLVNKRPDNVKRTIETLATNGVIRLPQIEEVEKINNLGLAIKVKTYLFTGEQGKRDSIIVVAQLCPEFTARLVDRWQELEAQVAQPVFDITNPVHLLQAIEVQAKQNIELSNKVKVLEPKAQALETIADTTHTYTIREVAKTIGIKEKDLISLLLKKKWCYRDAEKKLQPHADKREQGVFLNRPSPVIKNQYDGQERVFLHMRVTAFGLTRITGLVNKEKGNNNV
ncbi:MAG: phage antirepressor KilAC domain-containing protein [Acinetobacter populi]|jgi:phage regulator Rha-like protein|uniref:phage antirepressor KilAC domain-containing protein n=1 Tax=Acinetobacter populi TaxID=1582270 RepID=UPI0023553A15|nr:phage antirepressor KilAC domain-containing protein [Acinetobacter populi]MCH4246476.1 phage antirepressor KilAC domain-containing protein [Acinetobacter populi]